MNTPATQAHRDPRKAAANPFYLYSYGATDCYMPAVADQLDAVRGFTAAQCEAAQRLPTLPATVRRAVAARLKRLHKQAKGAP